MDESGEPVSALDGGRGGCRTRRFPRALGKTLLVVIGVARELPADGFRVRTATATIGAAAFAD